MKKIFLLLPLTFSLNSFSQTYNAGTVFTVYQDINPDTLLNYAFLPVSSEKYGVDLFDDSLPDIEFKAYGAAASGGTAAFINVTVLNTNVFLRFGRWDSVYITSSSYWQVTKVAKPLNAGDPINPNNAVWDNTMLYLTDHSGQPGGVKDVNDWIGGDKYLGVKYDNGSTVDYGWVRVQCITKDTCFVKDLSHSPSGLGVQDVNQPDLHIYPNPSGSAFLIDVNGLDPSKIQLENTYGQAVGFTCERKGTHLQIAPAAGLPNGCYLLRYSVNDRAFSKMLIRISE